MHTRSSLPRPRATRPAGPDNAAPPDRTTPPRPPPRSSPFPPHPHHLETSSWTRVAWMGIGLVGDDPGLGESSGRFCGRGSRPGGTHAAPASTSSRRPLLTAACTGLEDGVAKCEAASRHDTSDSRSDAGSGAPRVASNPAPAELILLAGVGDTSRGGALEAGTAAAAKPAMQVFTSAREVAEFLSPERDRGTWAAVRARYEAWMK